MTRSYRKNIRRTFKHTKSRFIAIFSIIALGVGFLAGLNATPVDMKESMEAYMKNFQLKAEELQRKWKEEQLPGFSKLLYFYEIPI